MPTIAQELAALEKAGELVPYKPRRRIAERRLYLAKDAVRELTSPNSAFGVLGIQGRVRDVLEHWTIGGRVWTDADGKPRLLKPIFPPEPNVWELMVIEPGAQVRLFSLFAEPDTLVVSHMNTRALLGRKNSQMWKDAKTKCMDTWNKLFPHPPFQSASAQPTVHEYVTRNCDGFPI